MPELPDVEVFRKYMDATSLNQKIEEVEVKAERILQNISPGELTAGLKGNRFESTKRYGKYLFAHLDNRSWLIMHFGMTGFLEYFKELNQAPSHVRLLITFTNGYHLAYDCQRKLGQLDLVNSVKNFVKQRGLGPDVLDPNFDFNSFKQTLSRSRAMIKSALMDQERMAGIGNIYADEILFQAGVHPKLKINQLPEKRLKEIYHQMKNILKEAIDYQADPSKMPDFWLLPKRDPGAQCPACGGEIEKIKVSGRSAYLCPNCQIK